VNDDELQCVYVRIYSNELQESVPNAPKTKAEQYFTCKFSVALPIIHICVDLGFNPSQISKNPLVTASTNRCGPL
jgi:hypothetical protein